MYIHGVLIEVISTVQETWSLGSSPFAYCLSSPVTKSQFVSYNMVFTKYSQYNKLLFKIISELTLSLHL